MISVVIPREIEVDRNQLVENKAGRSSRCINFAVFLKSLESLGWLFHQHRKSALGNLRDDIELRVDQLGHVVLHHISQE